MLYMYILMMHIMSRTKLVTTNVLSLIYSFTRSAASCCPEKKKTVLFPLKISENMRYLLVLLSKKENN